MKYIRTILLKITLVAILISLFTPWDISAEDAASLDSVYNVIEKHSGYMLRLDFTPEAVVAQLGEPDFTWHRGETLFYCYVKEDNERYILAFVQYQLHNLYYLFPNRKLPYGATISPFYPSLKPPIYPYETGGGISIVEETALFIYLHGDRDISQCYIGKNPLPKFINSPTYLDANSQFFKKFPVAGKGKETGKCCTIM